MIERGRYKRVFDLGVIGIAALALLPVWVALCVMIAVSIRLDSPGPVLYRQTRLGLGGRTFRLIKFRTMIHGAEDRTGPAASGRVAADRERAARGDEPGGSAPRAPGTGRAHGTRGAGIFRPAAGAPRHHGPGAGAGLLSLASPAQARMRQPVYRHDESVAGCQAVRAVRSQGVAQGAAPAARAGRGRRAGARLVTRPGAECALLAAVHAGLALVLLTPLVWAPETYHPFAVGKAVYARSLIAVTFALWTLLALRSPRWRPPPSLRAGSCRARRCSTPRQPGFSTCCCSGSRCTWKRRSVNRTMAPGRRPGPSALLSDRVQALRHDRARRLLQGRDPNAWKPASKRERGNGP